MANPYTEILAKLREALEGHEPLQPFVRPGNVIKPGTLPIRQQRLTMPTDTAHRDGTQRGAQYRIDPFPGGSLDTRATSSSAAGVQNYAISILTQTDDPDVIFDVKWAVEMAIDAAGVDLGLPGLVQSVRFLDLAVSNTEVASRGGPSGSWSALTVVSVTFRKPRNDLNP